MLIALILVAILVAMTLNQDTTTFLVKNTVFPKPSSVSQKPAILSPTRSSLPTPAGFTLSDKIGQLLVVGVKDVSFAKDLEAKYQIGGFLLATGSNLFSKVATDTVRQVGKLPPLFAIDQEGGYVSRLPNQSFLQYTAKYMGNLTTSEIRQVGSDMGRQMASIGAFVDYAPVVDLDDGQNAAISMFGRSFSNDPTVTTQKALAFASGLKLAGVIPTFKHFPGLGYATGPTNGDTDTGIATSPPLATLERNDLRPYETILATNTTCAVMVGNQIVPDLTNGVPASLSGSAYDLLRSKYHFDQVVFTDEIASAKAITSTEPNPARAVLAAIEAGADMPLVNIVNESDVGTIIDTVVAAVRNGQLSEARINASLLRVLQLKKTISTQR